MVLKIMQIPALKPLRAKVLMQMDAARVSQTMTMTEQPTQLIPVQIPLLEQQQMPRVVQQQSIKIQMALKTALTNVLTPHLVTLLMKTVVDKPNQTMITTGFLTSLTSVQIPQLEQQQMPRVVLQQSIKIQMALKTVLTNVLTPHWVTLLMKTVVDKPNQTMITMGFLTFLTSVLKPLLELQQMPQVVHKQKMKTLMVLKTAQINARVHHQEIPLMKMVADKHSQTTTTMALKTSLMYAQTPLQILLQIQEVVKLSLIMTQTVFKIKTTSVLTPLTVKMQMKMGALHRKKTIIMTV